MASTSHAGTVGSAHGDGYRPALDGVRGIAVLAVIAYHVTDELPGAFLGVDVFFVLSGYLITGLLLGELAIYGRIRLGEFWVRRMRRLLPAVLLLLAVVAVVTYYSASVAEFSARRDDMFAALFYHANWYFISADESYFATYEGLSPLRHMWSLAIEEQFYVVWPLVMLLCAQSLRRPRAAWGSLAGVVVALAASALAMVALYEAANPSRAYFGTDARAQAILAGAALAMLVRLRPAVLSSEAARKVAMWSWPPLLVGVAVAMATVEDQTGFYYDGGATVLALGFALIIWSVEASPASIAGKAMSSLPLRWIGLISYGLYLWQWPMIVWIGDGTTDQPWSIKLAEVGAALGAAALSYYLLERPVRQGRFPGIRLSRKRLVLVGVLAIEFVWVLSVMGTLVTTSNSAVARGLKDTSDQACPAGSPVARDAPTLQWCEWQVPSRKSSPVVATIGDSTSRALTPGFIQMASTRGWGFVQGGQGGCSFLPLNFPNGEEAKEIALKQKCVAAADEIIDGIEEQFRPDVWIVSDRVVMNVGVHEGGRTLKVGSPERDRIIRREMRSTVERLTRGGARVVLLSAVPSAQPVDCALESEPKGSCKGPPPEREQAQALTSIYEDVAHELGGKVVPVSMTEFVCPDGECRPVVEGVLGRYDTIHYTSAFSRVLAPEVVRTAEAKGVRFVKRREPSDARERRTGRRTPARNGPERSARTGDEPTPPRDGAATGPRASR